MVMGFILLTLLYFVAIAAAWYMALVGGMFLCRAGFRQPFGENPGYAMLAAAALLGLLAAIANPSVYLSVYLGVGGAARTIFAGFIAALIGVSVVAAVGYLLSPERVGKYYERTRRWMDSGKEMLAGAKLGDKEAPRDEPSPASGEQALGAETGGRDTQP